MALSRRLFIGGLLASAAAPAIITSKGFVPALATNPFPWIEPYPHWRLQGTVTGRTSCSEPAWQELRTARPYQTAAQREIAKRASFGARYGTQDLFAMGQRSGKTLIAMDFSEMELRMLAERDTRDMFNALKLNG